MIPGEAMNFTEGDTAVAGMEGTGDGVQETPGPAQRRLRRRLATRRVEGDRAGDARTLQVRMRGRFDLAACQACLALWRSQAEPLPTRVELDLSQVEFIESSGVGTLFLLQERAAQTRTEVVILGCSPALEQLLRICGVHERMRILPGTISPTAPARPAANTAGTSA